jgi:hypothetical protein
VSPVFIAIARYTLIAIFFAGMLTSERANWRMLKRSREAGYRYWLINPMSIIAGLRGVEPLIFLTGLAIMGVSMMGLIALK